MTVVGFLAAWRVGDLGAAPGGLLPRVGKVFSSREVGDKYSYFATLYFSEGGRYLDPVLLQEVVGSFLEPGAGLVAGVPEDDYLLLRVLDTAGFKQLRGNVLIVDWELRAMIF